MEKEPRQADLIINKNEDIKQAVKNTETRLKVPPGYYPIYLSTKGKLDVPKILHFRNFNLEEVLELSTITKDEERIFSLIKCMNNMIFEDIDCSIMHEDELTEVMMNIYFMFNSKEVGPYRYYIDDSIEDEEKKEKKKNIGKISFTAKDLNATSILTKFKEPIKITHDKQTFKFRLPRIKDTLNAYEYVLEKYKAEREKYIELEWKLNFNKNKQITEHQKIDEKEQKEYEAYIKKRMVDFFAIINASLLIGDDKKVFELEETMQKLGNNEIPLGFWLKYNKVTKDLKFGIDEDVTFVCPQTGDKILRRFLFQSSDFVPDMELQGSDGYEIQFGD